MPVGHYCRNKEKKLTSFGWDSRRVYANFNLDVSHWITQNYLATALTRLDWVIDSKHFQYSTLDIILQQCALTLQDVSLHIGKQYTGKSIR